MSLDRKHKHKPKKIFRTVIKISPSKAGSKPGIGPEIEIDTETLRPKLLKPGPKQKPKRPPTGSFKLSEDDVDRGFKVAERYDEALIQQMEWLPVKKTTRWECVRCGWCCSHEWRVNLTWDEFDRLKDKLPIGEVVVDKKSGMSHPFFTIKDKCVQYDPRSHKCNIYKERAYSCATYPFSLTPDGKLIRSKFCKGFKNGKVVDKKKMIKYIHTWRKRAGMSL